MDHVVIATADPERAAALYGARLGLDMALDRSHPDWGRLMFFRCGDLIVEVVHRPGKEISTRRTDRLWGLCWRVADIDATRARLASAGVDVSEARTGRKPGTRVMTVRNGTCGMPTLLVERTPNRLEASDVSFPQLRQGKMRHNSFSNRPMRATCASGAHSMGG